MTDATVEREGAVIFFVQQLDDGDYRAKPATADDWVTRDSHRNAVAEAAGTAVDKEISDSTRWDGDGDE